MIHVMWLFPTFTIGICIGVKFAYPAGKKLGEMVGWNDAYDANQQSPFEPGWRPWKWATHVFSRRKI